MDKYIEETKATLSKVWSYLVFFGNKSARMAGQSPDGRERALLVYVLQNAEKGNAESVLNAIDDFTHHTWLMNIGKEKGTLLESAVQNFDPKMALEIGTYCGYSAIRIASKMTDPNSKLFSVEMNSNNCKVARAIIEHAGLSSKVEVLEGTLSDVCNDLQEILDEKGIRYFDFIFMDHFKHCYLPDFLMLKDTGLIGHGTRIVADTMGFPEAADFLKYLKENDKELETEEHTLSVDFMTWLPCIMTVSIYKSDLHSKSVR